MDILGEGRNLERNIRQFWPDLYFLLLRKVSFDHFSEFFVTKIFKFYWCDPCWLPIFGSIKILSVPYILISDLIDLQRYKKLSYFQERQKWPLVATLEYSIHVRNKFEIKEKSLNINKICNGWNKMFRIVTFF